jgi:integrase
MTVYRRKDRDNVWMYEFVLNDVRCRRMCRDADGVPVTSETAALQAEKRAWTAEEERQRLAANGVRSGSFALDQAAAIYLKRKAGTTGPHLNNARLYVAEILGFFGPGKAMNEITDEEITDPDRGYCAFAARQTVKKWKAGRVKRSQVEDPADTRHWKDTGRQRSRRTTNNYLKALQSLFSIAEKVRDPLTKLPAIDRVPEIPLHKLARRLPRPMPDQELHGRQAAGRPWTVEAAELARLFGLRLTEGLTVQIRHLDRDRKGLRFDGGETKSGNEEFAFGGAAGWALLLRLEAQALARGVKNLITWPGQAHWQAVLAGRPVKGLVWRPLKSIRTSWVRTARVAGVEQPHRFHDVRARYITEVAKVQAGAAKGAARHQNSSTTDLYIQFADSEIADAVGEAMDRRPAPRLVGSLVGSSGPKTVKRGPLRRARNQ